MKKKRILVVYIPLIAILVVIIAGSVSYTHLPKVSVKWKRMWDFEDN